MWNRSLIKHQYFLEMLLLLEALKAYMHRSFPKNLQICFRIKVPISTMRKDPTIQTQGFARKSVTELDKPSNILHIP